VFHHYSGEINTIYKF